MERRVGIIPLSVYGLLLALLGAFAVKGRISGEITLMIAVLVTGGFTCAEIGKRIPLLNKIGGSSLVTIFLPSVLVAHQLLPQPMVQAVTSFTKSTKFIYLFITAVVVGSILSMDRKVLIGGFAKIFHPAGGGLGGRSGRGRHGGLDRRHRLRHDLQRHLWHRLLDADAGEGLRRQQRHKRPAEHDAVGPGRVRRPQPDLVDRTGVGQRQHTDDRVSRVAAGARGCGRRRHARDRHQANTHLENARPGRDAPLLSRRAVRDFSGREGLSWGGGASRTIQVSRTPGPQGPAPPGGCGADACTRSGWRDPVEPWRAAA